MHRFTLRQIEYFVSCYDCRSIAGAAEIMNLSQPTISVALTKLEDQLGVQLFLRHHSQGITPTASAEKLIQSARSLLAQSSDWQRQATMTGDGLEGTLNLGSFTTLAPALLPKLIQALNKEYPGIYLNLSESSQENLLQALHSGQIEMALLYDLNLPSDIRKVTLAEVTPYVALPENHPLAAKSAISLAELEQEPMILLNVQPSRDYFLNLFKAQGLKPNIAYTSPSLEMVRGLVGCGMGFALLSTRPNSDLTYDGHPLAVRPISGEAQKSDIILASLRNLMPTQIMTCFERLAKNFYTPTEI